MPEAVADFSLCEATVELYGSLHPHQGDQGGQLTGADTAHLHLHSCDHSHSSSTPALAPCTCREPSLPSTSPSTWPEDDTLSSSGLSSPCKWRSYALGLSENVLHTQIKQTNGQLECDNYYPRMKELYLVTNTIEFLQYWGWDKFLNIVDYYSPGFVFASTLSKYQETDTFMRQINQ